MHIPQKSAGFLRLPPISEPIPRGEHPEAINAASPPELPPAVLSTFQGFFVDPQSTLSLLNADNRGGTLDLTKGISPADLRIVIIYPSFSAFS